MVHLFEIACSWLFYMTMKIKELYLMSKFDSIFLFSKQRFLKYPCRLYYVQAYIPIWRPLNKALLELLLSALNSLLVLQNRVVLFGTMEEEKFTYTLLLSTVTWKHFSIPSLFTLKRFALLSHWSILVFTCMSLS